MINWRIWTASLILVIGVLMIANAVSGQVWWLGMLGGFTLAWVLPIAVDGVEARRRAFGDPQRDHKITELYVRLAELERRR